MDPRIIATIGPASEDYAMLKKIVKAGMNVARVNFSHATYDQWERIRNNLKIIKKETGITVKMMMDLQGPRVRIGDVGEGIKISKGKTYAMLYGKADINKDEIPVDYIHLVKDVQKGEPIYVANRSVEFEVVKVNGS